MPSLALACSSLDCAISPPELPQCVPRTGQSSARVGERTTLAARLSHMPESTTMQVIVALDCLDAQRLVEFWTEALGYRQRKESEPYVVLVPNDGRGPALVLQQVPEPKTTKNRMHLDIQVDDRPTEVKRLVTLGATVVAEYDENGWQWTTMRDVEGNEFDVF
jgi:predicted enzyme related to lactoylglutathione lyase